MKRSGALKKVAKNRPNTAYRQRVPKVKTSNQTILTSLRSCNTPHLWEAPTRPFLERTLATQGRPREHPPVVTRRAFNTQNDSRARDHPELSQFRAHQHLVSSQSEPSCATSHKRLQHPRHIYNNLSSNKRQFTTYSPHGDEDFMDDDIFGSGDFSDDHSSQYHESVSHPKGAISNSSSIGAHSTDIALQEHRNTPTVRKSTIFNIISGVSNQPVGVSVFRLSGPLAFPALALLSRAPLDTIQSSIQKKMTVQTLYDIETPEYRNAGLLREGLNTSLLKSKQPTSRRSGRATDTMVDDDGSSEFTLLRNSECTSSTYSDTEFGPDLLHDQNRFKSIPLPHRSPHHTIDIGALVLMFKGPASFTGEDVVELHTHGNPIITNALLSAVTKIKGVRLSEPGEFIRRAFQNQKLSLLQVDSYNDLINAQSRQGVAEAALSFHHSKQMQNIYQRWRHELVDCLAFVESLIDFGDEEGDISEHDIIRNVVPRVKLISQDIERSLQTKTREVEKKGLQVAIFGQPNVGKSSLLNTLIGKQLAIVSNIPGTTRDIVTTNIMMNDLPIVLHDTAGIRKTSDVVEWEGIRRAKKLATDTDYKIVLLDGKGISKAVQDCCTRWNVTNAEDFFSLVASNGEFKQQLAQQIQAAIQDDDISAMISKNTLLVVTKSDLFPFTQFTDQFQLPVQPTQSPLYLNEQSQRRASIKSSQQATLRQHLDEAQKVISDHSLSTSTPLESARDQVDAGETLQDIQFQLQQENHLAAPQQVGSNQHPAKVIDSIPLSDTIAAIIADLYPDIHQSICVSTRYNVGMSQIQELVTHFTTTMMTHQPTLSDPALSHTSGSHSSAAVAHQYTLSALLNRDDGTLSHRHRQTLIDCYNELQHFLSHFERDTKMRGHQAMIPAVGQGTTLLPSQSKDLVLINEYLRNAVSCIGKIDGYGDAHAEEVLDSLFNQFCIGK